MESFAELHKRARYLELKDQHREPLEADWCWSQLLALIRRLGVQNPFDFLAAAWWLPASARLDRTEVDRYAELAEQAIAEGVLPDPATAGPEEFTWDHVRRLLEYCKITPAMTVGGLLWTYSLTQGEPLFLDSMYAVLAGAMPDDPPAEAPPAE